MYCKHNPSRLDKMYPVLVLYYYNQTNGTQRHAHKTHHTEHTTYETRAPQIGRNILVTQIQISEYVKSHTHTNTHKLD